MATMRWKDFEDQQPRLADVGRRRLGEPGVLLVGTVRSDGSPRISAVEPLFWKGDLWLSMGWGSTKALDLMRDQRILVHSIVTSRDGSDGEFKLRGRAELQAGYVEAAYAERAAEVLGWKAVPGMFHLFRIGVEDVTFIRWDDATNDQYVTRWPAGVEYVRRGTSAISLGPAEPTSQLII
jgi:hypothetical protein